MPYFLNHDLRDPFSGNFGGTQNTGFMKVWRETSFRTSAPKGIGTKQLPLVSVEPWTWHESYEALKAKVARMDNPAAVFAKDRGHYWSSEKYEFRGAPLVGVHRTNRPTPINLPYRVYPRLITSIAGVKQWYTLPDPSELNAYGSLAYTQASPLSDEFSLPAFVGELREGLPSLIPAVFAKNTAGWANSVKGRLKDAKNAGGDYLNVQFGWIPLVNDVVSIAKALAKATVAITAMDEIHRYRALPIIDTTSVIEAGDRGDYASIPYFPTMPGITIPPASLGTSQITGATTYVQNTYSRMWFEGNFVKLPKETIGLDSHMERYEWLIKTDLTPSDLWQISPWSWLVDWFIDIGGLIDAFQTGTSNRILSTYAYAMAEEKLTTTVLMRNIHAPLGGSPTQDWIGPKDYSMSMQASRKRRIRADPFGFILNPSVTLNVGQQAILAALGLTKIK